jgi:hypothetical protein
MGGKLTELLCPGGIGTKACGKDIELFGDVCPEAVILIEGYFVEIGGKAGGDLSASLLSTNEGMKK